MTQGLADWVAATDQPLECEGAALLDPVPVSMPDCEEKALGAAVPEAEAHRDAVDV